MIWFVVENASYTLSSSFLTGCLPDWISWQWSECLPLPPLHTLDCPPFRHLPETQKKHVETKQILYKILREGSRNCVIKYLLTTSKTPLKPPNFPISLLSVQAFVMCVKFSCEKMFSFFSIFCSVSLYSFYHTNSHVWHDRECPGELKWSPVDLPVTWLVT